MKLKLQILDIMLKGKLSITWEVEIELIKLIFDSKIKDKLKSAEIQLKK